MALPNLGRESSLPLMAKYLANEPVWNPMVFAGHGFRVRVRTRNHNLSGGSRFDSTSAMARLKPCP